MYRSIACIAPILVSLIAEEKCMTNFLEKKMHDNFTLLLLEGRTLVEIVASIMIYAWHPETSLNRPHMTKIPDSS